MIRYISSLLLAGLLALGCSSNTEKAATTDNNSQPGPASSSASNSASNSSASNSSASSNTSSNNPDQQFINDAAKGNRAEIELGKMVAAKAKTPDVKKFAQMMVDDHTKALNELQQVAQKGNITLPDGIPEDAQSLRTKLESETGAQMEKDYMDGMVQDHQKDVQEFQDAKDKLQDPDLKKWTDKTLATIQKHLKRAQQVDEKVGGQTGSKS